jgi:hypothetical protein
MPAEAGRAEPLRRPPVGDGAQADRNRRPPALLPPLVAEGTLDLDGVQGPRDLDRRPQRAPKASPDPRLLRLGASGVVARRSSARVLAARRPVHEHARRPAAAAPRQLETRISRARLVPRRPDNRVRGERRPAVSRSVRRAGAAGARDNQWKRAALVARRAVDRFPPARTDCRTDARPSRRYTCAYRSRGDPPRAVRSVGVVTERPLHRRLRRARLG